MSTKISTPSPAFIFLLLTLLFSFERCSDKCHVENKYTYYTPVYSTTAEIKAAVSQKPAREIKKLGKIYFKDGYLFVNEVGEGIHIIDNRNPAQPQPLSFLNIPGNIDLAIQGNTLYADSYVDLVLFDITHIEEIKEINRIEGQFTVYNSNGYNYQPGQGIVTGWKMEENVTVVQNECETQIMSWGGFFYDKGVAMTMNATPSSTLASPSNSTGIGGSMARFTIANHFLYVIDGNAMEVLNIASETQPVAGSSVPVGWFPETLFPNNNNLFVGGRAGMLIFDLTTPEAPTLISEYTHISSCDPVVVEGDYAYVTLYDGDICHMGTNQLEVIDIKDLTAPALLKTYPMTNPHGLGISEGILFICDGSAGLRIFDATDPLAISEHPLAHYDNINALDVIPFHNTAMMIGADGLYQYDYSDIHDIKLLSQIPIVKQ